MRKRIAIAGHSNKGLSLIPLLEANPNVEVAWILTEDRESALASLGRVKEEFPKQYESRITSDAAEVFRTPGLTAIIEADPSEAIQATLEEAAGHGVQRTTPLVAKLLFAFGPAVFVLFVRRFSTAYRKRTAAGVCSRDPAARSPPEAARGSPLKWSGRRADAASRAGNSAA